MGHAGNPSWWLSHVHFRSNRCVGNFWDLRLNCRNVEPRGPSSEKLGTLEEEVRWFGSQLMRLIAATHRGGTVIPSEKHFVGLESMLSQFHSWIFSSNALIEIA